jgi:hypothetical protein
MLKKLAAWLATLLTGALFLYDKGVRGLGWLAGPADFVEYITTPLQTYIWPSVQDWVAPC